MTLGQIQDLINVLEKVNWRLDWLLRARRIKLGLEGMPTDSQGLLEYQKLDHMSQVTVGDMNSLQEQLKRLKLEWSERRGFNLDWL